MDKSKSFPSSSSSSSSTSSYAKVRLDFKDRTKSFSFNGPRDDHEVRRRKRLAGYNMYATEAKLKSSLRKVEEEATKIKATDGKRERRKRSDDEVVRFVQKTTTTISVTCGVFVSLRVLYHRFGVRSMVVVISASFEKFGQVDEDCMFNMMESDEGFDPFHRVVGFELSKKTHVS
ncbi:hypothetical protein OROGR_017334 [Orobanche gracilis]